jgi:hypothetical protein
MPKQTFSGSDNLVGKALKKNNEDLKSQIARTIKPDKNLNFRKH